MEIYQEGIKKILSEGRYKQNRTGVDTISYFSLHYKVDLRKGFPLLTTKKMFTKTLIKEFLWFISGDHHICNLQDQGVKLWDAWAHAGYKLETAYGRFWRTYPVPFITGRLDGESWPEPGDRWITTHDDGSLSIDQFAYIIDLIKEQPDSRRLRVDAWHPGNAIYSKLPPCHHSFNLYIYGDKILNLDLEQRSGDYFLGIAFNVAQYAMLAQILAQNTGCQVGELAHKITDAHAYCGKGERGEFYKEHLPELQQRMQSATGPSDYLFIKDWIISSAPNVSEKSDHVPQLLEQLARQPYALPQIEIAQKPLDDLVYEDFEIKNYEAHPAIKGDVAV